MATLKEKIQFLQCNIRFLVKNGCTLTWCGWCSVAIGLGLAISRLLNADDSIEEDGMALFIPIELTEAPFSILI